MTLNYKKGRRKNYSNVDSRKEWYQWNEKEKLCCVKDASKTKKKLTHEEGNVES